MSEEDQTIEEIIKSWGGKTETRTVDLVLDFSKVRDAVKEECKKLSNLPPFTFVVSQKQLDEMIRGAEWLDELSKNKP